MLTINIGLLEINLDTQGKNIKIVASMKGNWKSLGFFSPFGWYRIRNVMFLYLEICAYYKMVAVTQAVGCRTVASVHGNAPTSHTLWWTWILCLRECDWIVTLYGTTGAENKSLCHVNMFGLNFAQMPGLFHFSWIL